VAVEKHSPPTSRTQCRHTAPALTNSNLTGDCTPRREQRTNEGPARAVAEGKKFGRRPKLIKHQVRSAKSR
jgi:hypothetical protein